ncbi:MAG: hypothetical protein IJ250_02275 [Bacteroidales bacterium]|nr:hypothetical protein [Bacteroidales bacterium]
MKHLSKLLFSLTATLMLLPVVSLSQNLSETDYHNIALGNKNLSRKTNVNIGLAGDVDTLQGVQFNLFSSVVRKQGKGLNDGLFASLSVNDFSGVQLSSLTNITGGAMTGVQASGLTSAAKTVKGVQMSAMNNISGASLQGLQLSGICNIAVGIKSGVQISGIMNVCADKMNGFQFSIFNYCDTLHGGQLGLVNICISHPKGMQIGIVNYMRDDVKRKIGLVNISPKTNIQMFLYGGNSNRLNIAARFLNQSTYSMLGLGTHYMGLNKDFSGSVFYRTGLWFTPYANSIVSSDLGFYHIETFNNAGQNTPERLYSLQARINYEYQVNPLFRFFFSLGYGVTRYYNQNEFYRKRFLFDMGIILF